MERSESIAAIGAALAKAQGEMATAAKDSKNPHFGSKYADLASIWNACREPLAKNGIAVVQAPGETAERVVTVTTLLTHSSGEWIEETLTIPMAKIDAQGYGSAVTYARRYALAAMVGIAPAEDDGNAAAAIGKVENTSPRQRANPTPDKPPVEEPKEGWSAWAVALEEKLGKAATAGEVETIRADEDAKIKAVGKADAAIYQSLGKAFGAARDRVAEKQRELA